MFIDRYICMYICEFMHMHTYRYIYTCTRKHHAGEDLEHVCVLKESVAMYT